jgi:hypothetical protein
VRRDSRSLRARGPLSTPIAHYVRYMYMAGRRDRRIGKPGKRQAPPPPPPPRIPHGTPYALPSVQPRRTLGLPGPPLARGLGWRHWGAITGPWCGHSVHPRALRVAGRYCFTYIGSPNGPIQRPNPVRYVQCECHETTARSEIRKLARVRPARCPAWRIWPLKW